MIIDCIQSWHKYLPDYTIVEWNESNYASSSLFFNTCLKNKKYAFASDYARIDLLSKYGGIYLDTDMLLLKNLDLFLNHQIFFGLESKDYVSCGVIGSMNNNIILNRILFEFDQITYYNYSTGNTIVKVITNLFRELGYEIKSGNHEGVMFYPIDFFLFLFV
jgi:mannosyltransferase OCH1-like enzyme